MQTAYYEHAFHQALVMAIFAGVGGPLAAIGLRAFWFRIPQDWQRTIVPIIVVLMAIGGFFFASVWSLTNLVANGLVLVTGYFAYCAFALWLSTVRPRVAGIALSVIASAPIVINFVACATILPISMGIGEVIPSAVVYLTPRLSYSITYYGGATVANNGAELKVSTHPRFAPFLEHNIFKGRFQDDECDYEKFAVSFEGSRLVAGCPAGGYGRGHGKQVEVPTR